MSGDLSNAEVSAEATADRREWVEFVHFRLGDEAYELELGYVKRMVRNPAVTRVPQTETAIAGVTNLSGEITVVIDGRGLFDLPERPTDADAVLIRLDRGNAQPTGFLVDDVPGIDPHHVDQITALGDMDSWEPPIDDRWFRAVIDQSDRTGRPVGVIDVEAIIEGARYQS